MDPERPEVYERIPWETLDQKRGERQWLAYAVAAAVTLGALAYSFTRNQPLPAPASLAAPATTLASPAVSTVATPSTQPPATAVPSPLVVAEADLYAIDPERLFDQAVAHAEWVAVEYVAMDGSEQSGDTLAALLPDGLPLPTADPGVQVFVDWVGARSVTQKDPTTFQVDVLVRSMASSEGSGFTRQPPRLVVLEVEIGQDGVPRISDAPRLAEIPPPSPAQIDLQKVPQEVASGLGGLELVGGRPGPDGNWDVVVLQTGADGVTRPVLTRP